MTPRAKTASVTAVLRSEWTKMRSIRSTVWTAALAFPVSVGLGVAAALSARSAIGRHSPQIRPDFNPADAGFFGIGYGQLCFVVFAVLVVGSEYKSGSIRGSLIAVPVRGRFYACKLIALAVVAFAASLLTALVSFAASERALAGSGVPLGTPGLPRALLGTAAFITLISVFSAAVAFIVRSSAMALSLLLPFYLVVPTITADIPGLKRAAQYLPDQAGLQAMQIVKQGPSTLTPGAGLMVLAAWTALAVLSGFACLRARDV